MIGRQVPQKSWTHTFSPYNCHPLHAMVLIVLRQCRELLYNESQGGKLFFTAGPNVGGCKYSLNIVTVSCFFKQALSYTSNISNYVRWNLALEYLSKLSYFKITFDPVFGIKCFHYVSQFCWLLKSMASMYNNITSTLGQLMSWEFSFTYASSKLHLTILFTIITSMKL